MKNNSIMLNGKDIPLVKTLGKNTLKIKYILIILN